MDTHAKIGLGPLTTLTGKVDAKATQTASVSTTAEGAAKGDVAIGAALALTIADHEVSATTLRDLSIGGSASFQAFGSSATLSASVASAAGAAGESSGGGGSNDVNGQADKQLGVAKVTHRLYTKRPDV